MVWPSKVVNQRSKNVKSLNWLLGSLKKSLEHFYSWKEQAKNICFWMELHIFTFGAFYRPHKKPFGFTNVDCELWAAMNTKHNFQIWKASGVIWTFAQANLCTQVESHAFAFSNSLFVKDWRVASSHVDAGYENNYFHAQCISVKCCSKRHLDQKVAKKLPSISP